MIFLTVGMQLPFDRLTAAMAAIAPQLDEEIVAQVGDRGQVRDAFTCHRHLDPETFDRMFSDARLIVAHAGMGTVLTARQLGKPLVVMPRRYDLGEHRNDHQVATAARIADMPGIDVVEGADELHAALTRTRVQPPVNSPGPQRDRLAMRLKSFIDEQPVAGRNVFRSRASSEK